MREFDLEAAKRGEPIQCRDGTPAKFIAHVPEAGDGRGLVAQVDTNIVTLNDNGRWGDIAAHRLDLFMAPNKRTVWVNLYKGCLAEHYPTEAIADGCAITDRIGNRAYPVEIEE